jgi:uncharacterized protein
MGNGYCLPRNWCLVALALCLAGCVRSQPTRFYTLTARVGQEAGEPSGQAKNPVSVSIAPIEIPDYLDRPQIVTRDGSNELKLAEFDRWAGSLSDNIASVLAENLASLLGSDRVLVDPRIRTGKVDFAVTLRVLRLDCLPGDKVLLKAQWTVFAVPEKKELATHLASFTEKLGSSSYEAMAVAVSQILAQLSREIAHEIIGRPAKASN